MKIKNKISLSFLFIFFGLMSMVGVALGYFSYQVLQVEAYGKLNITAESQAQTITSYLEKYKEDINIFAQDPIFKTLLADSSSKIFTQATKKLKVVQEEQSEYYRIYILDKQGQVVASSQKELQGQDKSNLPLFTAPLLNKTIYTGNLVRGGPGGNILRSPVSAPIISDQTGEFLGVLAADINPEKLYQALETSNKWKGTEEMFLVNEQGKLLSPTTYLKNKHILKTEINNKNTKSCFKNDSPGATTKEESLLRPRIFNQRIADILDLYFPNKNMVGYQDYRGEEVLGTHAAIPGTNWCLIAKINKNELLANSSRLIFIYFSLLVLCLLIYFLFTYLISKIITRPIEQLRMGVKQIEKGDLDYKIETSSKDEIGDLAHSFSQMLKSIKKSGEEADKKVKQQTKEIQQRAEEMERQRKAILNVLEDVEEEKEKFQKEKDKTEAVLHSIGDGVLVVDKDLNVVVFNEMAVKISGYGKDEIIGKKYNQLLKFVDEADTDKNNNTFIEKAMETGEIQEMPAKTVLIAKDGKQVPVADSASPLKDKEGNIKGCVVVFQDVTKEREIDKAKTEFVSLASHQLRTPLSSINWYAEMLMDGDAGELTKEQEEFLGEIYKGNQRMVDLVNALLNVSRLELGTFAVDPKKVNVEKMINETLKELKPTTSEKNIKIVKNIKKKFSNYQADPNLLRIIIQNLLSNAVKYTQEKGKVKIGLDKENNGDMKFSVADNGMGIPKGQQSEIFKKLFRADNVKQTDAQGTGLGLYIVKSIVDYTGGKIWFTSAKGKGTTFHVVLPKKGMQRKEGEKKLGE
jgi:PAS domain S-box-containing protein